MQYKAIKLVKRPNPDITADIFATVHLPLPALDEGQFLVRQTHMSLDPAMRTWLDEYDDSYLPPVQLGETMRAFGVGEVVESRNPDFPVGARVLGTTGWAEYVLGSADMRVVPQELPVGDLLGALHLPGLTAYLGLMEIGRPKAGETLVVTGAAGSVGSLVGQIGKAEGLRVVGFAGSDEKCAWLEQELGFDKAINYRAADLAAELAAAAPNGVDLFFENTGGPVQEVVFQQMNRLGRIIVCGVIADYNKHTPSPGPNWKEVNLKALRVEGFVVPDHFDKIDRMSKALLGYLQQGQLCYRLHTIKGLESAIDGINMLFDGRNQGKLVVEL
ncbi:NADP-dependent oxidoreductase [Halopseudomonas maritima]|uniref:NADP-dependent oxidoreductase n=1 Tax=Halopseudomonas maritima TaxID=2918528 RepID=UPI001EEAD34E|nr:NADP-dependent oxidoreductase [Halopseudomonas maritima]UJJ32515.1 NADP-dependent oxidoreductase [Halopseudomonas maritima]